LQMRPAPHAAGTNITARLASGRQFRLATAPLAEAPSPAQAKFFAHIIVAQAGHTGLVLAAGIPTTIIASSALLENTTASMITKPPASSAMPESTVGKGLVSVRAVARVISPQTVPMMTMGTECRRVQSTATRVHMENTVTMALLNATVVVRGISPQTVSVMTMGTECRRVQSTATRAHTESTVDKAVVSVKAVRLACRR
jgi:hypothetical protein